MKTTLVFFLLLLFVACTPPEIESAEKAKIRYCRNCITIRDAIQYEVVIGSTKENLKPIEIGTHISNMVSYLYHFERDNYDGYISQNDRLFKRESSIKPFSEYILYSYFTGSSFYEDSTLMDVGMIDFNMGNSGLGFVADTSDKSVKPYMLTAVSQITLTDFRAGYYSILKWLYSLETKNSKVVKSRIKHFDKDKYSSPEVELEDMVLEDPWQEEFLFHKYELKGDDDYSYFVSIEPKTYAPIYLYEKKPDYYKPGEGYYINISDMAIRIRFSAEFTGLDKAL